MKILNLFLLVFIVNLFALSTVKGAGQVSFKWQIAKDTSYGEGTAIPPWDAEGSGPYSCLILDQGSQEFWLAEGRPNEECGPECQASLLISIDGLWIQTVPNCASSKYNSIISRCSYPHVFYRSGSKKNTSVQVMGGEVYNLGLEICNAAMNQFKNNPKNYQGTGNYTLKQDKYKIIGSSNKYLQYKSGKFEVITKKK